MTFSARATNPFTFGDLALDEAFTDREDEVREITADMRNGQNVLVYGPRRYGKSSLVLSAIKEALAEGTLVAYVDLMKTPKKERFAAALAKAIFEDIAPRSDQIAERAAKLFSGLRVRPVAELDMVTGTMRFSFEAARRRQTDIDDTIEQLLELLQHLAGERRRRVVLVLDEFQEIVRLDKDYPNLLRAVFQAQPEVGHVYLGSKRHILDKIFNDRNEPFWKSSKRMEVGLIPKEKFAIFIGERFEATDKGVTPDVLDKLLDATEGHPYATQELCYFVWELVPDGHHAFANDVTDGLTQVLRTEHNHFSRIWDDATENERSLLLALTELPLRLYTDEAKARHGLRSDSHVQRAVGALEKEELIGKNSYGEYRIIEPFLREWIRREQGEVDLLRLVESVDREQGVTPHASRSAG